MWYALVRNSYESDESFVEVVKIDKDFKSLENDSLYLNEQLEWSPYVEYAVIPYRLATLSYKNLFSKNL